MFTAEELRINPASASVGRLITLLLTSAADFEGCAQTFNGDRLYEPMLTNGSYSVWFQTPQAQGTGIVVLEDGRIAGEDTVIAYCGFYEEDGDNFTAVVQAKRYCEGQPSVFGIDEFELKLKGRSTGTAVECSGTTDQAPGLFFKATLIRIQNQDEPAPRGSSQSTPFNAALFPIIHGDR